MNNYKERNYSERDPEIASGYSFVEDYSDSNSMHDANVGVTHFYLKDDYGNERIVSDVELVMTNDPSVTSQFSPEYLAQLKNTILSKPHSSLSNVNSKDDPIGGHVYHPLERDELFDAISDKQSEFHKFAMDTVIDDISK